MAQLFDMRARMKKLMGVMQGGSIPALSDLQDSFKTAIKVSLFFFSHFFSFLIVGFGEGISLDQSWLLSCYYSSNLLMSHRRLRLKRKEKHIGA